MYTVFCHLSSQMRKKEKPNHVFFNYACNPGIHLGGSKSSPLCLQKLLDILNALLSCHADDVIQRFHVDQHLHGLSDQVPDGR